MKGKVAKILTWRWAEVPKTEEVKKEDEDLAAQPSTSKKPQPKPQREFFVKWHDMSYWHCSWISEVQVRNTVFHFLFCLVFLAEILFHANTWQLI